MRSSARSWRFTFVVVLALQLIANAAPAAFAGSGSIEGTVTAAADGALLENIAVKAIPAGFVDEADAEAHGHGIPAVLTGVDGKYVIPMVPEGFYYVKFYDPTPIPLAWATQWFDGAYDWPWIPMGATPVEVFPNLRTSDVDAAMLPSSYIGGNVTACPQGPALEGIQVIPWYEGSGISWEELMTAVETGRYSGGAMENDTDARHRHLPRWIEQNMTWTDAYGDWGIGPVEPTTYRVYFHDPSGMYAPSWQEIVVTPGEDSLENLICLREAGWLYGWVDGDLGNDTEYPLEDVKVWVYATYDFPYPPLVTAPGAAKSVNGGGYDLLVATTRTDYNGYYEVEGLPAGEYKVVFDADGYNHFDATSDIGRMGRDLYYSFTRYATVHAGEGTELCALLVPRTWAHFVHPPFGVNDGPDRYNTAVTVYGWGMFFAYDFHFELWRNGVWIHTIYPHTVEYVSPYEVVLHLNLASPVAPVGTYELDYAWANWQYQDGDSWIDDAFQVVNSYVPTTPITPPAPAVTPTLPVEPTPTTTNPPVVVPEPAPEPVAGPVTVAASAASVKKGAVATLKFQVNEAVLGGETSVKVVIKNKAGKVVKQVKATVKMNAAASISFRCKLAKGSYSYTVSAGSASATSKLIVK